MSSDEQSKGTSSESVSNSIYSQCQDEKSDFIKNIEITKKLNTKKILFIDSLNKILFAKTRSDRSCFNNISDFLMQEILNGKFDFEIFNRAIELAKEAKSGENPNALFMSLMRSQLGYRKNNG